MKQREAKVVITLTAGARAPEYQTQGSAGADLQACIPEPIRIEPGARVLVPTGVYMQLPEGYEAQVRSRSGLALRFGIACLNAPGTIDSDYRGEVGVILVNHGDEDYVVHDGDRIAQLVDRKSVV